jgi:hypothetical protein
LFYVVFELVIIGLLTALLLTGGSTWPVNQQLQITAIFCAFLVLLYLLVTLALTRGLAGVALTLTTQTPLQASKLGWHLFSHRLELIAVRLLSAAFELVMALPLLALAAAFITAAPPNLNVWVTIGVGIIAWFVGALLGAGTASWWAALYRRLVLADHPGGASTLLSGPTRQGARRGPLAMIIALSSFLVAAALAIPWVSLG